MIRIGFTGFFLLFLVRLLEIFRLHVRITFYFYWMVLV